MTEINLPLSLVCIGGKTRDYTSVKWTLFPNLMYFPFFPSHSLVSSKFSSTSFSFHLSNIKIFLLLSSWSLRQVFKPNMTTTKDMTFVICSMIVLVFKCFTCIHLDMLVPSSLYSSDPNKFIVPLVTYLYICLHEPDYEPPAHATYLFMLLSRNIIKENISLGL